ncbi:hypothetical protein E2C01_095913 [Portunus trituberculatus]|uniref:Uncharacterized protein n=1 Tax=Portunus trituberculatus TaxID=210409 RepID=A0A5B7K0A7_PORTR|nr:hypothetical protein [Portunus trituberculatus]
MSGTLGHRSLGYPASLTHPARGQGHCSISGSLVLEWPQHTIGGAGYTVDSLCHIKKDERTKLLSKKKERKSPEGDINFLGNVGSLVSLLMTEACC